MGATTNRAAGLPEIPKVPSGVEKSLEKFLSSVKVTIDTREGRTNDQLERVVTFRSLQDNGIDITTIVTKISSPPSSNTTGDKIPPGAPTDMSIAPYGLTGHRLQWTNPDDDDLYYIEIFRAARNTFISDPVPGFADADLAAVVTVLPPNIGNVMSRNLGGIDHLIDYYYWLRAVDYSGNASDAVFVGSVPYLNNPSLNDVINDLVGDVQYSHLNSVLQTEIDKINILDGEMTAVQSTITTELDHTTGAVYAALDDKVAVATYNGDMAAVQSTLTAHTNDIGDLEAEYFVKLDVNGYVSGFGIVSTGGTTSTIFRTDRFIIAKPDGSLTKSPFILGTTASGANQIVLNSDLFVDGAIHARMINGVDFGNLTISSGTITLSSTGKLYISSSSGIEVNSGGDVLIKGGASINVASGGDISLLGAYGNTGKLNLHGFDGTQLGYLGGGSTTEATLHGLSSSYDLKIDGWGDISIIAGTGGNINIYGPGITTIGSTLNQVNFTAGGNIVAKVQSTGLHPYADSSYSLGSSSLAWSNLYVDAASIGGNLGAALGKFLVYSAGFASRCYIDSNDSTSSTYSLIARDSSSNNAFYVRGDKEVWCYNGVWYTSDESAKEHVADIKQMVSGKMMSLPSRTFRRKGMSRMDAGFLASELQTAVPEAVQLFRHPKYFKKLNASGAWGGHEAFEPEIASIKDGPILAYVVKWSQEQQTFIDALTARIETLERAQIRKAGV